MEQINEKTRSPTLHTTADSDVESIIKPEKYDEETKPLPKWQNNVFLRTKRRRLASAGILTTIVLLAVALGVVGALGLLRQSGSHGSQPIEIICTAWQTDAQSESEGTEGPRCIQFDTKPRGGS